MQNNEARETKTCMRCQLVNDTYSGCAVLCCAGCKVVVAFCVWTPWCYRLESYEAVLLKS